MQTDPVGTRDDFNLYAYTSNNPANAIDPLGMEIVIRDVSDRERIQAMINARVPGQFAINEGGRLQLESATGGSDRGSEYYQSRLVQAIADEDTINVDIAQTYMSSEGVAKDVDLAARGGVTVNEGEGNSTVTVSGNRYGGLKDRFDKPLRDDPEDILAHELVGHAIPLAVGPDTGNAVENENKVRSESGRRQRQEERDHSECGKQPCPR